YGAPIALGDGSHTLTYWSVDNAGNSEAPAAPLTLRIDGVPPTVSCAAADTAWHASDVSIACSASDTGSGLASAGDAAFTLTTSVQAGTSTANASTDSHQVCDGAGNCVTAGPVTA